MTSPVETRGHGPGVVPRVTRDDLVAVVVLGVLYYAAARLGLRLAIVEENITPLWPPTGLALVAFLRYGRRLWPGVAIAAFLVNLPITNVPAALLTAAGNTIAPMVAAWLLERAGFRQQIDRVRDVAALVGLGALASMTISATIGSAALLWSSQISLGGFWSAWTVWWTGDAMGILVVAPFLLCVLTWDQVSPRLGLRRLPEALLMLALLLAASLFALWDTGQLLFLLPPLVGWIAWRFQLRGAAPAVLLVSVVAAWAATRMVGWFADLSLTEEMLTLQLFNATIAFTAFFLSALVSERTVARERLQRAADDLETRVRQRTSQLVEANEQLGHEIGERREAETRLRRSEHELAEAQTLARLGRWEWDLGSGTVTWSDDLYRIHGYEPGAFPMTFDKAVELVLDEDRQRIERNLAAALAMRQREMPEIEYRIVRPDGELRVLLGRARLFFDEAGSPVRMVGVVQDVTERVDYDRQHRIAETLQRALLPQDLPAVDGLALAARYLPAEVGFKAGGDWYDVIPLAGGRVGLVIGDVAGHGLEAASVMGQLRMAVRAYALEGHRPADVVAHADSVLRVVAPEEITTMAYAEVDPATGEVRLVSAGHPPPIAIDTRGARYLELPKQPPIGVASGWSYDEAVVDVPAGGLIVLYTDGLIDRRDIPLDEGLDRLLAAAGTDLGRPAEALCRALITALVPHEASDDIAVLAMERLRVLDETFRFRMPAEPAELARMRRALGGWLRGIGVGPDDEHDLVLACAEACSNAIRHAYGPGAGTVDVEARREDGAVEIAVRDFGRWRSRRRHEGGRGLALIEALAPSMRIERSDRGTVVTMRRTLRGSVTV
ncbi:MAG TPA: SpoIIE family protein phosphatase [Actinomycetota bacterium]|nr:SpoIIE family protein phosphatase [Actinomycetota bacterium]